MNLPISSSSYLTFIFAVFVLVIIPGPSVTIIIANSLKHGVKAGFLTILGTQAGFFCMLLVLAYGFEAILSALGPVFDGIRFFGAIYLIWLGYQLIFSQAKVDDGPPQSNESLFFQGMIVVLSNPKVLLFLGAFFPQFISPNEDIFLQIIILGMLFMVIATFFDSLYAMMASHAGVIFKASRRKIEILSGSSLILGGIWLSFLK